MTKNTQKTDSKNQESNSLKGAGSQIEDVIDGDVQTIEPVITKVKSGVSPLGVVFLCLLTMAAMLTGAFAYRDVLIEKLQPYFVTATAEQPAVSTKFSGGFVPIPAMGSLPSLLDDVSPKLDGIATKQTKLEQAVASLTEQLDAVKMLKVAAAPANDVSEVFGENLAQTEAKLAESLQQISQLKAQFAQLQNFTTELAIKPEKEIEVPDIRGLIAFQTLQSKAISGQTFQADLQRVIALLDDSSVIEGQIRKLEEVAPIGRPSLAYLRNEFSTAVSKALKGNNSVDESFTGKVKQNLSSFIRVRRTDGQGSDNEKIITLAESALAKGQVEKAYLEVLKLDDAGEAAFTNWLPHAKAYYHMPKWLGALQLELTNSLDKKAN